MRRFWWFLQHNHWKKYYSEIIVVPFDAHLTTDENLIISANSITAVHDSGHDFCQHLSVI